MAQQYSKQNSPKTAKDGPRLSASAGPLPPSPPGSQPLPALQISAQISAQISVQIPVQIPVQISAQISVSSESRGGGGGGLLPRGLDYGMRWGIGLNSTGRWGWG